MVDHRLSARDAEAAAGALELGQAANNGADGGAIGVGDACHVKNYEGLLCGDHLIDFAFEASALGATVNAAAHFEDGHAGGQGSFCEVEDHAVVDSSPS
jgi:hypothetical protein